jgi:hypothetical protein
MFCSKYKTVERKLSESASVSGSTVCGYFEMCSGETDCTQTSILTRNDRSEHKFDRLAFPQRVGTKRERKERNK